MDTEVVSLVTSASNSLDTRKVYFRYFQKDCTIKVSQKQEIIILLTIRELQMIFQKKENKHSINFFCILYNIFYIIYNKILSFKKMR